MFMWPSFHGQAVLLTFEQVRAPLSVTYGKTRTKIVDEHFSWLQIFPDDHPHYVLTAMFNDQQKNLSNAISILLIVKAAERTVCCGSMISIST
ncbi:hypothetical protein QS257_06985 [Terrilactibacillus sp. S3-3]|nr:hypothetical protein QS257_06985 [Terrilactibacillus sp. S3-3]